MEISKQLGGFTPAEADDLRKAIGKKKRDLMATMKDKFIDGCATSGTQRHVADDLWGLMTAAADYSFNKSHAACYAMISYRTAYLKANYPAEYMAAVISSVMSTKDKVPFFVNRCAEMGIEVLPPDVNSSEHSFTVSGNSIRFGLDAVKNVGHQAVDVIMAARERGGPFESIWDFCDRVDARAVNKRAIECLVKCGALDSTGASRRGMLEVLPAAQASGQKAQDDALRGQGSIFDFGGVVRGRGSARRRLHVPAPADPGRGVRPARAALAREGDARHVPLVAPAQGGARSASREGRLRASRSREEAGRRVAHRRRHRRRGEEGPHPLRQLRDVREARRPRGTGRALHPRRDLGGGPGRRARPRRDRPRPARPQGARPDIHPRPGRRDLRAGRDRDRPRQEERAARGAHARDRRLSLSSRADRRAQGPLRDLSRAAPR